MVDDFTTKLNPNDIRPYPIPGDLFALGEIEKLSKNKAQ